MTVLQNMAAKDKYSDALAVRIFSKNTLGKFLPFFRFLNPNLGKCKNSQLEYFCPRRGPLQLEYFCDLDGSPQLEYFFKNGQN